MLFIKLEELLMNLFANAVSFTIGVFLPKLWTRLTKARRYRALRKFWSGIDKEVLIVTCVHKSPIPDGEETAPMQLGFGDAFGMKYITELLTSQTVLDQIVKIREYYGGKLLPEDYNKHNLICIGGGIDNQVTTDILYKIGVPRHFFDRKNSKDALESKIIRNKENTFSIKATIKEGTVIEDVGIIVKSRHPNNPG